MSNVSVSMKNYIQNERPQFKGKFRLLKRKNNFITFVLLSNFVISIETLKREKGCTNVLTER